MLKPLRLYTNAPAHSRLWVALQALNSATCLVVVRPLANLPAPQQRRTWCVASPPKQVT